MGFVSCMAPCYGCHRPFSFNPNLVPSIRINDVRQPICQDCVEQANPLRERNGLPKIEILPGAYDACDEAELG